MVRREILRRAVTSLLKQRQGTRRRKKPPRSHSQIGPGPDHADLGEFLANARMELGAAAAGTFDQISAAIDQAFSDHAGNLAMALQAVRERLPEFLAGIGADSAASIAWERILGASMADGMATARHSADE